ncbi:MAG TPA: hypothetical protein PLG43_09680 [Spirochaetia bacterium]|nr:hypothetical protein [Spirochaetia bacterium]
MAVGRYIVLFLSILLLFSSCGDTALFMERPHETDPVTVRTIPEGAVISAGSPVPYNLSFSSSAKGVAVTSLSIEVIDRTGSAIVSEMLGQDELSGSLPELILSGIPTGEYILRFVVKEGSEIIHEKAVTFFFSNDPLAIREIRVYPPAQYPGSEGLLYAELASSASAYLRWSVGKEVIAQGTLSEGFGLVRWSAPQTEGVYTVKLEAFPVAPASGTYSFDSPIAMSAQAFVSKEQRPGKYEFQPDDRYYSILHFRGNLRDTGIRKGKTDVKSLGTPVLTVRDGIFGYALDKGAGFGCDGPLVPLDGGRLLPFSLKFRMIADSVSGRSFFSWMSDSGDMLMRLSCEDEGNLVFAAFPPGASPVYAKLSGVSLTGLHTLTVSVFPQKEATAVAFYVDDSLRFWESYFPLPASFPKGGRSLIGGDEGFSGVIDEFGVYSRDSAGRNSADADIFANARRIQYGDTVLLAEGFDGSFLPHGFAFEGMNAGHEGSAVIERSLIRLTPGTDLVTEVFSLAAGEAVHIECVYSLSNLEGFDLVIDDGKGKSLYSLPCSASGKTSGSQENYQLACSLACERSTSETSLVLEWNRRRIPLHSEGSFRLRFSPRGELGGGGIDSVLMVRSGSVLPNSEDSPLL